MEKDTATQGWWQSLPGVITAVGGFLTALTALVIALHQTGLIGKAGKEEKTETTAPAQPAVSQPANTAGNPGGSGTVGQVPPVADANGTPARSGSLAGNKDIPENGGTAGNGASPQASGAYDPQAVFRKLQDANIGSSVGEKQTVDWLDDDDRTYRRIAENTLEVLGGKRMNGAPPDIDVIKYRYLELLHRDGAGLLPLGERVNRPLLKQAILMASNEKNGGNLQRFERALANR